MIQQKKNDAYIYKTIRMQVYIIIFILVIIQYSVLNSNTIQCFATVCSGNSIKYVCLIWNAIDRCVEEGNYFNQDRGVVPKWWLHILIAQWFPTFWYRDSLQRHDLCRDPRLRTTVVAPYGNRIHNRICTCKNLSLMRRWEMNLQTNVSISSRLLMLR